MTTANPPLSPPQPRPRSRRRRLLLILLGAVLLLLLSPVALYFYLSYCAEAEVQSAIADIEAQDPHWRLHEIEAQRAAVPDEENSALLVKAVSKALPPGWSNKAVYNQPGSLAPPFRLDPQTAAALRTDLQLLEAELAEARKLAKLPRGRFALDLSKGVAGVPSEHWAKVRACGELLNMDALRRAEDGDFVGAWESGHALLNASRSFGDEALAISGLTRIAVRAVTLSSLQRTLAQGQVPEPALAAMQKLLDEESALKLLPALMRWERAYMHETFVQIETGNLSPLALGGATAAPPTAADQVAGIFLRGMAGQSHAWTLRYMTRAVELSRLPDPERLAALGGLETTAREAPALARTIMPAMQRLAAACIREQGRVDGARAALAAERYRIKQARWPGSLAELVGAGLLPAVPLDPFDGQPLRLRRTADGLVVYSIGPDLNYRGDGLDDLLNWDPAKVRVEFRLWDPARRALPPPPPRP